MTESLKDVPKKGRPKKPGGALTSIERQASYRKKKLAEGIEISLFLKHEQAAILREMAKRHDKTQSVIVGELLEKHAKD